MLAHLSLAVLVCAAGVLVLLRPAGGHHLFLDDFNKCLRKCHVYGAAGHFVNGLIGVLEEAEARDNGTANATVADGATSLCAIMQPFMEDLDTIRGAARADERASDGSGGPVASLYSCVRQFADKNYQDNCAKAGRCLVLFSTLLMNLDGVKDAHALHCDWEAPKPGGDTERDLTGSLKAIGDALREHVLEQGRARAQRAEEGQEEDDDDDDHHDRSMGSMYGGDELMHGYAPVGYGDDHDDHQHDHSEEP